jgi:hypothetical protein
MRHYAPATTEKVLPFMTQLAGAVDFARAAGIGHGALHPRDIFVSPDEARATGFGVVQALERIGVRAPVRRPYTAPERVDGGSWDVRADVYSLAAIAYELITGKRPVGADVGPLGEAAGPHASNIAVVLARGLADDPASRYDSALAFAAAFEGAARGERPAVAIEKGRAVAEAPVAAARAEPPGAAQSPPLPLAAPEQGQRGLTFEPELEEQTRNEFDIDRIDQNSGDAAEDIEIERDADLEEIQLREDETLVREVAVPVPAMADDRASDPEPASEPEPVLRFEQGPRYEGPSDPVPTRAARTSGDDGDRPSYASPRPMILPVALTLLLGLFVGFLAGYLVGARERSDGAGAPAAEAQAPPESGSVPASQATSGDTADDGQRARPPAAAAVPAAPRERAARARATPPPARATARGRLVVRSTPPGAQVYINGRRRGATPLAVRDLAPATYTVRVARSGYREQSQRISVSASGTRDISFRLQRAPAPAAASTGVVTGSVYVDSRPRGARVLLDNKPIGVTPLQVGDISVGAHVVRLELDDHRPWTASTRVSAGQVARVTGSLERVR